MIPSKYRCVNYFDSFFHTEHSGKFTTSFHWTDRIYCRNAFQRHDIAKLLWDQFLCNCFCKNEQQKSPNSYCAWPFGPHLGSVVPFFVYILSISNVETTTVFTCAFVNNQYLQHSPLYAHLPFIFVSELQLYYLSTNSLYANPFRSLLTKSPCISSHKFENPWYDLITLESQNFKMIPWIFNLHILENPTHKYVLRPFTFLFSRIGSLLNFEASAFF